MKLILKESVTHLGEPGDTVRVKRGFARNYLLPKGLAIQATEANMRAIGQELGKLRTLAQEKRERAKQVAEKLADVTLTMERKVADADNGTLYGSVSVTDIGDALAEAGYEIDRGNIHLEHPIKQLGHYEVTLSLAHGVRGMVNVHVRSEGGEVETMKAQQAAYEQAEEAARQARAEAAAVADAQADASAEAGEAAERDQAAGDAEAAAPDEAKGV